jgi:catechol 2,3-dioxygenase-like lactoylglutathione lyase family enzyme
MMDLTRSHWWYQRALGFVPAGERRHREGELYAAVPGLPEASFDVACLLGRQDFFQLEMFEFARPRMQSRSVDWRPCDIGYSMFGVHVADFDETLRRILAVGGRPLTPHLGDIGRRRVCLADPDGILVELMEDELFGGARERSPGVAGLPAVASVTISVPSVVAAREFWIDVLGCAEASADHVHSAEHERLWGLEGAERRTLVVRTGDVALELVEYAVPRGKPRPAGYLLSDQGILNVAFGSTDKREFDAIYDRAVARGYEGHREPWTLAGAATVVYLTDNQGLSVELLHVEPAALDRMGFRAARREAALGAEVGAVMALAARKSRSRPGLVDGPAG